MRDVEVYRAELLGHDAGSATYEIECSAGTYVRTLIETLGDAYCSALRRTAIGPFEVEDAGEELGLDRVAEVLPEAMLAMSIEVTRLPERPAAAPPRCDRHLRRRPPAATGR